MKQYTGTLKEVGPWQVVGCWAKYSYIKLGGQVIKNLYSTPEMATILKGQIGKDNVTLHVGKFMTSSTIFAVKQSDGQTFRASATRQFLAPFALQLPVLFICAFMLGVFPIATLFLFLAFEAALAYSFYLAWKPWNFPPITCFDIGARRHESYR